MRRASKRPHNFSWVIRGKLAGSARPENEAQLRWLRNVGIKALVCLNKEHPLDDKQVRKLGFEYLFLPVKDFTAPTQANMIEFVRFTHEMIEQDMPIVVCCGAGIGRTSTMLAAYLVSLCFSRSKLSERSSLNEALAWSPWIRGKPFSSTHDKWANYRNVQG